MAREAIHTEATQTDIGLILTERWDLLRSALKRVGTKKQSPIAPRPPRDGNPSSLIHPRGVFEGPGPID
jgi:hypothetical protein